MDIKDMIKSKPEEPTAYLSYMMDVMVEIAAAPGHTQDISLYEEYRDEDRSTYQKLVDLMKCVV